MCMRSAGRAEGPGWLMAQTCVCSAETEGSSGSRRASRLTHKADLTSWQADSVGTAAAAVSGGARTTVMETRKGHSEQGLWATSLLPCSFM